jgi:hypothetical protein
MQRANEIYRQFVQKHPDKREEAEGLYDLLLIEIEDGNSEAEEVNKFISALNDLVE